MKNLNEFYNDQFYQGQMSGSYKSAVIYLNFLSKIIPINSVVDVGCGRGAWLKVCKELGAEKMLGFDGEWNSKSNLVDSGIEFVGCDLNHLDTKDYQKFDLAMSLEVAEHLDKSSAMSFVEALLNLSDVILFGAAIPGQGGDNHINEQPQSYWAKIFSTHDYVPFDIFRPDFWGNEDVEYWYQQNTFLYIRRSSKSYEHALAQNLKTISNLNAMDCIHPELYNYKLALLERYSKMDGSIGLVYQNIKKVIKNKIYPNKKMYLKSLWKQV